MLAETNVPAVDRAAEETVLISRVFDAPRDLVFDAWTRPEYLMRWFAPRGCTFHIERIDVRAGGGFHSCVRDASFECWCLAVYREIVRPERLVYTLAIADQHGNKVAAADVGHDQRWPSETLLTVTFEELGGKTKLTLHQDVSEALAKQTGAYPSWIEMFQRLDELLRERGVGSVP